MNLQPAASDNESIRRTIQNYIDGYVHKDVDLLGKTFSAGAKLKSIEDGELSEIPTSEWFLTLQERKKAGQTVALTASEIKWIHQTGRAAMAIVHLKFPMFVFTDYLSLLETKAGWRIVSKIYMAEP